MIQVGSTLNPVRIESVSTETMKDWAGFLQDPNPIHLDIEVVKEKGLGDRLINQGPINVAYVMNMLMTDFPTGRIVKMDTRFMDNVFGGEAVETYGSVTDIEENDHGLRVSCEVGLKADERDTVIAGTAVVQIPK